MIQMVVKTILKMMMMTEMLSMMMMTNGGEAARDYDLGISGGRVNDPETGMDAVRDVGVSGGVIAKISKKRLRGETVIDASGKVVAPGFIDRNT